MIMYSLEESILLLLNSVEGLYSNKQFDLINAFGSAKNLYDNFLSSKEVACKIVSNNIYDELSKKLRDGQIDKIPEKLYKDGISVSTFFSRDYPQKLKDIPNPPTVLYYKGDFNLLDKTSISVVGSRKCTNYGAKVAKYFIKDLAEKGFVIISGMALGIDEVAHKSALEFNAKTVAVLGSGFNYIYPSQHIGLSKIIAAEGLLMTEFAPDIKPQPYHFPMRNRIVSGLSDGLLIVEAGRKSGTYTTLNHALEQGKKIYVVPNDIFSFASFGSNDMLKSLQGAMVTEPKDILDDFGISDVKETVSVQLDFDEQNVVDKLKGGQMHFNDLLSKTALPVGELQYILSNLEIRGIISKIAGNYYKLTMEAS